MPSGNVAVVTSSGKAYYKLVTELRKRGMDFLSLTPNDPIPINVRAVITTEFEKSGINHSKVFVYNADDDPVPLIDEVIQAVAGRDGYEKLVFGVDPGKRLGVAIMGDDSVIRTIVLSSVEDVAKVIAEAVNRINAEEKIVKIGDGASAYQSALIQLLDEELPSNIIIESVEEKGTTRHSRILLSQKKRVRDIDSAIQISMRKGSRLNRGKRYA